MRFIVRGYPIVKHLIVHYEVCRPHSDHYEVSDLIVTKSLGVKSGVKLG